MKKKKKFLILGCDDMGWFSNKNNDKQKIRCLNCNSINEVNVSDNIGSEDRISFTCSECGTYHNGNYATFKS